MSDDDCESVAAAFVSLLLMPPSPAVMTDITDCLTSWTLDQVVLLVASLAGFGQGMRELWDDDSYPDTVFDAARCLLNETEGNPL